MNELTVKLLCKQGDVDKEIIELVQKAETDISSQFNRIDEISEYNQLKVLNAMQKERLDATNFNWTTGYGYGDVGREKVEKIYSNIFNTEDALVRPTIVSGTHALSLTLFGILLPGDELISAAGAPYDTLLKVIGEKGDEPGTLLEQGIKYKEIPLNDESIDVERLVSNISSQTKIVLIQRSTGYSFRKALTIEEIEMVIKRVKMVKKDVICMVDNCYGEFVHIKEPSDVGADIVAGSLIKNPGGGLALTGGYIVGRKDLIERIANKSTAPGIGKECGLTFGTTRRTLQGLFLAPKIVSESIKTAILAAKVFSNLGYEIIPKLEDERSDIIQAIKMDNKEKVIKFCQSIQASSPVDSHVKPEPWDMPGYDEPVIMASGAFVEGSSIELSADAPIREPYIVYLQGGLNYYHGKYGIMKVLSTFKNSNLF
ncbi:methionine gamma-lyase family protein [Clostridium sp. D2Q-11]|uniref:Methionine gamma-lyase family protein n=1 Tax=Anaeromonas frigoriresistens TaxID=2683708 RepID=A0A942UWK8_9FIRM|nr:methionine gamma-lyase family protein [Anaeromonas frigoriresistens]MBS4539923.1 methionine gamma-lyase family protein [Anaeromonas frigoriresistens]